MSYRINLASDLRTRCSLWEMAKATEKDELGQYPVQPRKVADLWCAVVPQTGSLLNGRPAETQLSRTTHKVVIRYRQGVREDMWLEVKGTRYDILYILDPYLRATTLELFCEVRGHGH